MTTPILGKYGISSSGFAMPSSASELFDDYKASILQALPQIDLRTGSIFNLFLNANNNVLFNLLEQFEGFYYSKNPDTAVGIEQDSLYAINDLERIPAASSVVSVVCTCENSTVIKANSQISNPSNGGLFINEQDEVISTTACVKILISLANALDNASYNLSINGFYCGITSGSGATSSSILNALAVAINAEFQNIDCTATNNNGVLEITSNNLLQPFSIALSSNFVIGKVSSVFTFHSVNTGKTLVNASTITQINTLTSGWDSCYNPTDGQLGRYDETDQEFRERQARIGIYNRGSSTESAILNAFGDPEQISGISYAKLEINDSEAIDSNGLPPRSIHLIVEGSSDIDIANLLWQKKAGGIKTTYGNTSVTIKDIQGNNRVVKFTRPVKKYVWLQCTTTAGGDYSPPTDYVTQIKNWIVIYGSKLKIGDNIMLKVAAGFALANVSGLSDLQITATATTTLTQTPVNYGGLDIAISSSEIALFDASRISVV
jgi:hypothetical protein